MDPLLRAALAPDPPGAEAGLRLLAEASPAVAALVAARPDVAPAVAARAATDRRDEVRRAGLARTGDVDLLAAAVARGGDDVMDALRNPACPPGLLADEAVHAPALRARAALANPSCPEGAADEGARRHGPARLFGTGSPAARLAWASAVLAAHPALAAAFAGADDPHTRRAVLRLPDLPLDVAAAVVATRASGMHTLARNPYLPLDLAGETPSKRRRRAPIEDLLGDAPGRLRHDPSLHAAAVDLGSGTVDLLLVAAPALAEEVAVALAGRSRPPVDGWVLAVLVERFGLPTWRAAREAASSDRRAAAAEHSPLAAALRRLR